MHDYATNPGSDERVRELEREARSSGDPLVAYQAYVARRGAGLTGSGPAGETTFVVQTKHGPFTVSATGTSYGLPHLFVQSGDHQARPVVGGEWPINRVPMRWTAHFYRLPSGEWLPLEWAKGTAWSNREADDPNDVRNRVAFTDERGELYRPRSATLADMLERPCFSTSIDLSDRWDGRKWIKPSDAQQKKAVATIIPLVQEWARVNAGGATRAGSLGQASGEIRRAEEKITELEAEIGELQRKIGEAYLVELGAERENPPPLGYTYADNPPADSDRAPFYEWVEAYGRRGTVTGDEFYRRFPKLSRDALEHDARMAGESVEAYLVRTALSREPLYRALRAQVRDASHRQLADYAAYFAQTMVSEPDWRGGPVPEDYYAANPQGV